MAIDREDDDNTNGFGGPTQFLDTSILNFPEQNRLHTMPCILDSGSETM